MDTDIGSDVDDAQTLALLLGKSEISFEGITTVYGDTDLRARIAARYVALANRSLNIYAGENAPLSGREVWLSHNEGSLLGDLTKESYCPESAVEFLIQIVAENPGQIEILAIGPLTNIATAIQRSENFAKNLKHLWIMGGEYRNQTQEHNLVSDDVACTIVFESNISATVIGLEMTQRCRLSREELTSFSERGKLGKLLFAESMQWINFWNEDWSVPHDPLAAIMMLNPELFEFSEMGKILFSLQSGTAHFAPGGSGNFRIVTNFDPIQLSQEILGSIFTACDH